MATHSSILAWRIPWTEEPGGLQFMGSQRVGHDWVTHTHTQPNYWWDNIIFRYLLHLIEYNSIIKRLSTKIYLRSLYKVGDGD